VTDEEQWPAPKIKPMPDRRARRLEINSNTVGAAGVVLVDVAVGALVALVLGALVGVLVAMLLLGLALCRMAWALHQAEQLEQPDDEIRAPWPVRQAS